MLVYYRVVVMFCESLYQGKSSGVSTADDMREQAIREARAKEIQAQIAAQVERVLNNLILNLMGLGCIVIDGEYIQHAGECAAGQKTCLPSSPIGCFW
jgi:hypothetical protein